MKPQEAINLLVQMYLPCFSREEKEALDTAIEALEYIKQMQTINIPVI